jgi:hypothetical protein
LRQDYRKSRGGEVSDGGGSGRNSLSFGDSPSRRERSKRVGINEFGLKRTAEQRRGVVKMKPVGPVTSTIVNKDLFVCQQRAC